MQSDQFLDAVNLLSLIIGLQNLQENRLQSAHNDIHAANAKQTEYLLVELTNQFEKLSSLINKILEKLEEQTVNWKVTYTNDYKETVHTEIVEAKNYTEAYVRFSVAHPKEDIILELEPVEAVRGGAE